MNMKNLMMIITSMYSKNRKSSIVLISLILVSLISVYYFGDGNIFQQIISLIISDTEIINGIQENDH